MATVVSTRVLSPKMAVAWAAFFNFVAFLVFHTGVAKTIGSGIVDISIVDANLVFGALCGACAWNILTWWWGPAVQLLPRAYRRADRRGAGKSRHRRAGGQRYY